MSVIHWFIACARRASVATAALLVAGCAEIEFGPGNGGESSSEDSTSTGGTLPEGGEGGGHGGVGGGGVGGDEGSAGVQRVFVTSKTYTGDLGGFNGADDLCDGSAVEAGLSGRWRAWLGTNSSNPSERLVHSPLPYVRLDGVPIASDWDDLTDGTLAAPILIDETGSPVATSDSAVWTAAEPTGLAGGGGTCSEWTAASSGGIYGDAFATEEAWTHAACQPCTIAAHLYCFEEHPR